MAKRAPETDEDIALRGLRYTKEQLDEVLTQTEKYVRQNPGQALLYAFVAGYLLNRLPLNRIVGSVLRLSMFALKPAILAYGASKLYEVVKDEE
jgi:hypothetical protein